MDSCCVLLPVFGTKKPSNGRWWLIIVSGAPLARVARYVKCSVARLTTLRAVLSKGSTAIAGLPSVELTRQHTRNSTQWSGSHCDGRALGWSTMTILLDTLNAVRILLRDGEGYWACSSLWVRGANA